MANFEKISLHSLVRRLATSSAILQWIDNDLRNTVPIAISSLVNDSVNVNRLYSSPVYIRWDHTWNLF